MVESTGFEPVDRFNPIGSLANCWYQPLTQLSIMAVVGGFEPSKGRFSK